MRLVSALKSLFALIGGFYITFAQNHSALAGLQVLSAYCVAVAIALLAVFKLSNLPEAIVMVIFGVFGHLMMAAEKQLVGFTWMVTSLSFSLAIIAIYQSAQLGFRSKAAADTNIVAGLNLLTGILFLTGNLDEVAAVGFFGAYLVLIAVHLGISAASPLGAKSAK